MSQEQTAICPVIEVINDRPATTSLKIAECFEKNHQHVLRDIRTLIDECPKEFGLSNFGQSTYTNEHGKSQPNVPGLLRRLHSPAHWATRAPKH